MAISREEVLKAASLARMELDPQEVELFSKQLESILGFIDQLKGGGCFRGFSDESCLGYPECLAAG